MDGITSPLPIVHGSAGVWGGLLNDLLTEIVAQSDSHDVALNALQDTIRQTVGAMLVGQGITFSFDRTTGLITAVVTATTVLPGLSNTALPAVQGQAVLGGSLNASSGSWTPVPQTYGFQWRRDGMAIDGATGPSYVVVAADTGHALSCVVAVSHDGYTTTYRETTAVSITPASTTLLTVGLTGVADAKGGQVAASYALTTEAGDGLVTQAGDALVTQ